MADSTATSITNDLAITKDRVKAWSACADGYRWFLDKFPQGGEFAAVYRSLIEDRRGDDADWLVGKLFDEFDTQTRVKQMAVIAGADARAIAELAESGAEAATTGDWANAATTGYRANAATTGDWANAATTGKGAIAAALGSETKARASAGDAIVIVWRAPYPSGEFKVFASKVGENGIKPDVWYELNSEGVPVEASDE